MSSSVRVAFIAGHDGAGVVRSLGDLQRSSELAIVVSSNEPALATQLRERSRLRVTVAEGRTKLERGLLYIVPSTSDATIDDRELVIEPRSLPYGSVDRLWRAAADELGRACVAILLDGDGTDGTLGLKAIKEAGGLTVARSDTDSEMPATAIATGLVDLALPLGEIAKRLPRLFDSAEPLPFGESTADAGSDTLRDILTLVRVRTGHDFSAYKRATLSRRLSRRMQVCQTPTLAAYHQHLREHPGELTNLLRDFLISVTNFFRDPETFERLAVEVVPRLFTNRAPTEQVRVWVPGCATGEEAYSLAMLLCEEAQKHALHSLQVFATDIDEEALAQARIGRYPDSIAVDVSPARLARFFVRDDHHYRVSAELREMVLFSPHNLLRDPPFSRLDLISCRNLLIYLNREAQERLLNVFHFALAADGYLCLGSSESAENTQLFSPIDAKARIYQRRATLRTQALDTVITSGRWQVPATGQPTGDRASSIAEMHLELLELYAPPSILVNDELDIVHVSEHAGRFLQIAGGEPTRHLLRLAIPPLRLELRAAIYAARQHPRGSDTRVVEIEEDGTPRRIELRVHTRLPEGSQAMVLILFDELKPQDSPPATAASAPETIEPVVRQLEDELQRTRDQLRNTIEQYETSVEELKASNEELQAINEELRSATEELETSKEELQSVNEELTTLNQELKGKVEEVILANSDLQNLMSSTDIGVVFLDRGLNIKRFTPRVKELFNVIHTDIGRPFAHLTHRLSTEELPRLASAVLADLRTVERDVVSRDGRRYLVRLLPYRSLEDRIDGVVLTFVDVTTLRDAVEARARSEAALQSVEERLQIALRAAPIAIFMFDHDHRVTWAYAMGRELPIDHEPLSPLSDGVRQRLMAIVRDVAAGGQAKRAELELETAEGPRMFDFRVKANGTSTVAVGFDITPRRIADAARSG